MYFCYFVPNYILLVLKHYLASPVNDMALGDFRGTYALTGTYSKILSPTERQLLYFALSSYKFERKSCYVKYITVQIIQKENLNTCHYIVYS